MEIVRLMLEVTTLFAAVYVSYCIKKKKINDYKVVLTGTNLEIKCPLDTVTFPSWDKINEYWNESEGITQDGSAIVNPGYYAKERIQYSADNSSLIVSNVTSRDAGKYGCSVAQKGRFTYQVDVDELKFNQENCNCPPRKSSGKFMATTGCLTQQVVTANWSYIIKDKVEVPIKAEIDENPSGCTYGKSRLASWFQHDEGYCLRSPTISIKFLLQHNTSTVVERECTCEGYVIDGPGCPSNEYIACIVIGALHVLTTISIGMYHLCKHKCERMSLSIFARVHIVLILVQVLIFVLVSALPPYPDEKLSYNTTGDFIAVIAMAAVFLIVPIIARAYKMFYSVIPQEGDKKDPLPLGNI